MNPKLTTIRKNKLIKEFEKIKSIQEKFIFWQQNLETEYIEFLLFNSDSSIFSNKNLKINPEKKFYKNFEIKCVNDEEKFYLSEKVYESCFEYNDMIKFEIPILTLDKCIEEFELGFLGIVNKKAYLERELNNLKDQILKLQAIKLTGCSSSFTLGYDLSYLENKILNIALQADVFNNISCRNGYALGQYHLYLEDLISDPSTYSNKVLKRLRVEQQLLALDYLGVFEKISMIKNASKQEEFLSLLVGKSLQNVKIILKSNFINCREKGTYHNCCKTYNNFYILKKNP